MSDSRTTWCSSIKWRVGEWQGVGEGKTRLQDLPANMTRDAAILTLTDQQSGWLGTLRWIDEELKTLTGTQDTASSFDSELALVLWPNYSTVRWQPNLLHHRYDSQQVRDIYRTMMVARLDGPSVEIAKRLVDDAIEVETTGLSGTIYLDGRGQGSLEGTPPGSRFLCRLRSVAPAGRESSE